MGRRGVICFKVNCSCHLFIMPTIVAFLLFRANCNCHLFFKVDFVVISFFLERTTIVIICLLKAGYTCHFNSRDYFSHLLIHYSLLL